MASCYDCIHCDVCSGIGSCSYIRSDVSKCKFFKHKDDVEEVVHGKYVVDEVKKVMRVRNFKALLHTTYKCSECGSKVGNNRYFNFCRNCGAKMDGGEEK